MRRYVVFEKEQPEETFVVINASSDTDLKNRISKQFSCHEAFRDFVDDEGLYETMLFDETGLLFDGSLSHLRPDLLVRFTDVDAPDFETYKRQWVAHNVYEFFQNDVAAELYLRQLEDETVVLPDALYEYVFKQVQFHKKEPYANLVIVDVTKTETLVNLTAFREMMLKSQMRR